MSNPSKKTATPATPETAEVVTETFAVPFLSILKGQISDPVEGRSKPAERELVDFGTKNAGTLVGARDLRVSVEMDRERNLIRLVAEEAIPAGTVIADVVALSLSPSLVMRVQKSLVTTGVASKLNADAEMQEMMRAVKQDAEKGAKELWAFGFSSKEVVFNLVRRYGIVESIAREIAAMTRPASK